MGTIDSSLFHMKKPTSEEEQRGLDRVRALLQGATYGFGEEAESKLTQGDINDIRAQMRLYQSQHPWENMGLELLGGLPTGGGFSKLLQVIPKGVKGLNLLRTEPGKLGSLIKDAAIQSYLYGIGSGEGGALNRLKQGSVQGAQGAVLSPLLLAAGKGVKGAWGIGNKLLGNANVEREAAKEIARAAQADIPVGDALSEIARRSREAEALLLSKGVQSEPMLATHGGKNIEGLLRTTSGTPGKASTQAVDIASDIKSDLGSYLENILRRSISDPTDPNFRKLMDLKATRAADVEPLYQQAFQNRTPLMNQELLDISKRLQLDPEVFTEAFKQARRAGRRYPTTWVDTNDLPGKMTTGASRPIGKTGFTEHEVFDPDIQFWDMVKRSLYQREKSGATDPTSIRQVRKDLMHILDTHPDVDPAYAQARKMFTDESDVIAALEQGKRFKQMKPDELEASLGGLSTSAERESFLNGMVNSILEQSGKSDKSSKAVVHSLLSPENREKLSYIIPNRQNYDEFINSIEEISKLANTADIMSRPGRSMMNADAATQEALQAAGAGAGVVSGVGISSIANALSRALRGHTAATQEELNDTILRMLSSDPADIIPQLEKLVKPTLGEKLSEKMRAAVPTVTGVTTGLEEPSGYPEE